MRTSAFRKERVAPRPQAAVDIGLLVLHASTALRATNRASWKTQTRRPASQVTEVHGHLLKNTSCNCGDVPILLSEESVATPHSHFSHASWPHHLNNHDFFISSKHFLHLGSNIPIINLCMAVSQCHNECKTVCVDQMNFMKGPMHFQVQAGEQVTMYHAFHIHRALPHQPPVTPSVSDVTRIQR